MQQERTFLKGSTGDLETRKSGGNSIGKFQVSSYSRSRDIKHTAVVGIGLGGVVINRGYPNFLRES